ncbi:MAG: D-arabinono-1,4-lactone oxidase [Solirubrobacteraceae bacterium]
MQLANWAGNHVYRATELHRPATLAQLREIVARAPRVHALGTRHSFSDIADSAELVALEGLAADVDVDRRGQTVTCSAWLKYGELAEALAAHGMGLHNLASLPHISIAGAITTATHGSGDANGNLATAVRAIELVTSDGEVLTVARGEPDFDGLVVGLGALGIVTRVTLDVEPAYEVRQRVFEGLSWDALHEHFDAITASGYSVSVFTRWGETVDQVWIKSRVTDAPEQVRDELFGAVAATVDRHPILGLDPINCTPQLGVPGPWSDRLPHFRMGFTPSNGEEIQSEYHVARDHAEGAIRAVHALGATLRPVLQVSEIRTIAADELWMSPQYRRASVALHFTWMREPEAVAHVLVELEAALAPFGAQPHWGKAFRATATEIAPLYERLPDFARLAQRLDPRGAFRNDWLERHVLGDAP